HNLPTNVERRPKGAFLLFAIRVGSNLPQVRQNCREQFCIIACGDPQGESQDETSASCTIFPPM
ncbi:hypothetical protein L0N33_24515, partial [Roseburia faecis]|nr:hypothetical protein [Roseburia faecis]